MNPFALSGPPFLLCYFAFAVLTVWVLNRARRTAEDGEPARVSLTDPYTIAYLRGGANETIRVAVVSLVDRKLLRPDETKVQAKKGASSTNPLESAILAAFQTPAEATSVFTSSALISACRPYETSLQELGLIASSADVPRRFTMFGIALGLLWGVTGARLVQAFGRGRHNVGFLVVLTFVFTLIAAASAFPKRTGKGDRLLADLKVLFSGLKERASSIRAGSQTAEAALLASVFGLALLPMGEFAWTRRLYPKTSSSSSSSSCGSSCGGGCSGGCGGGCGGCGG